MGFILIQKGVFKTKLKRDFKTGVENLIPFMYSKKLLLIVYQQSLD